MTQIGPQNEDKEMVSMSNPFLSGKDSRCRQVTITISTYTRMKPSALGPQGEDSE